MRVVYNGYGDEGINTALASLKTIRDVLDIDSFIIEISTVERAK